MSNKCTCTIALAALLNIPGAVANDDGAITSSEPEDAFLIAQQPYPPPYPPPTGPVLQPRPRAPTGPSAPPPPELSVPPVGGAMPQPAPSSPPGGAAPLPPSPAGQSVGPASQTGIMPGPSFADVTGRFTAVLPQGSESIGASYSFRVPAADIVINVTAYAGPQELQNAMQSFPMTLQQAGLKSSRDSVDFRGRPMQMTIVYHGIVQGVSLRSHNVFIAGSNLWIQVLGADQSTQQLAQAMRVILDGLQY